MVAKTGAPGVASLDVSPSADGAIVATLSGDWTLAASRPRPQDLQGKLTGGTATHSLTFDTTKLEDWDSSLLLFVRSVSDWCKESGIGLDTTGLPRGLQKLLHLATAVPERKGARRQVERKPLLDKVGEDTIAFFAGAGEFIEFFGESILSVGRFLRGRARFRRVDFGILVQDAGAQAVGIVGLISFLVGVILAFLGAVQLQLFGAQIFVANLVGIGMARELGPIMTGIVLAGRTGAAYAAQIGTMQVNEEIDALKTLGISPIDFLVLPRMLALILMMPLLVLYADLLGILGGAVIGVGMLDIGMLQYVTQTRTSVPLGDFAGGIFKGTVFGVLIAIAGCLRGIQCGRSASAVGDAATSAVVTSIILIIATAAVITVIFSVLGI